MKVLRVAVAHFAIFAFDKRARDRKRVYKPLSRDYVIGECKSNMH